MVYYLVRRIKKEPNAKANVEEKKYIANTMSTQTMVKLTNPELIMSNKISLHS